MLSADADGVSLPEGSFLFRGVEGTGTSGFFPFLSRRGVARGGTVPALSELYVVLNDPPATLGGVEALSGVSVSFSGVKKSPIPPGRDILDIFAKNEGKRTV